MASRISETLITSAVGITFAAFFTGGGIAITYVAVPTLLIAPAISATSGTSSKKPATSSSLLARQWQQAYDIGSVLGPVCILLSATSFAFTALRLPSQLRMQKYLFFAAAASSIAAGPFTPIVMGRTNNEISGRASLATAGKEDKMDSHVGKQGLAGYQTTDLINKWATLNMTRALIPLIGIGVAVTALVL